VTFGKLRGKLNDNIKTYHKGVELGVRNGLIWFRIGTNKWLLWTRQ